MKPRPTNVQAEKNMREDFKIGRRGAVLSRVGQ
ncbi:ORF1 in transposon ISC1048 [Sulfolobus islandicus Y.G.57.14]|uniref:ORF1 in transposon ISC1048 n=1 Tax=Saccharolobus islandicus (strain Y.G.57.14 / Yellowstone \|nr:ORF1 in transposon ISC1048 [Sulfolobus islandicus Y.G.57.14]